MSKVNKENELYPAEKYSFNSLWNSQKNMCKENKKKIPIYKMTNLLPATARLVLGDRGNTWQLQSDFLHQGIQKSFDYGIIKKENVKPGPAKMKTEIFKSKPNEQSFAYLDDDFSLDSEETNDAEEELYENGEESVDNCENYLNEHVVFNEKALSPNALSTSVKLNSRNVCEKSEEQMELEEAYTRVNGQTKHLLHCVCNSNVPPSWILSTFLR